jgi:hypothetical protein
MNLPKAEKARGKTTIERWDATTDRREPESLKVN